MNTSALTLQSGTVLSDTYQIIRIIGQGGMGVVYMAYDTRLDIKVAREPADIFAIGRILHEVAEGKITEQVKPFKQVRLSNLDTDYRRALNAVIMSATTENPGERIKSAQELKDCLLQIHYCRLDALPMEETPKKSTELKRFL